MYFLFSWLVVWQLSSESRAKLDQALNQMAQVQMNFKQETFSDFFDETQSEGTLTISRPGKMRMKYTIGEKRTLIWDGLICYEYDQLADTESRTPQTELADEPLVRLLLYGKGMEDQFVIDRIQRQNLDVFRLRPRGRQDYQIELALNENQLPIFLEILGNDGEGTRFWFTEHQLKPKLTPETFQIPPSKAEHTPK